MYKIQLDEVNFWRLANPEQFQELALVTYHNFALCMASVLLAILSAGILFPITERYHSSKRRLRNRWLWAGSIAMGLGIWAMHFTALMALHVTGLKIEYSLPITALSILPAILCSACCIVLANISKQSIKYLYINALTLTLGVMSMLYIGMEGIIIDADMYYDTKFFILSIIAAYLLALFSLYIHIKLTKNSSFFHKKEILISSVILGIAISGMYFIAVKGIYFHGSVNHLNTHNHEINLGLFISISIITVSLIGLIVFGTFVDRKISKMAHLLVENEQLFTRLSETTQTAIFTFNENNIIYSNLALRKITDLHTHKIYTKPIEAILGEEFKSLSKKLFDPDNPLKTPFNTQYEIRTTEKNTSWLYLTLNTTKIDNEIIGIASAVDITSQKEIELNMRQLAYSDQVTDSPNRRSFIEYLENRIHNIRHSDEINACYVLLIDMDNFKSINDSYGHQYGDQLIKKISKRLDKIRPEKSFSARQGGDEFIVLIEKISDIEKTADSFIEELSRPYSIDNKSIQLDCSMGIYQLNSESIKYDQIINDIDIALFRAKQEHKSKWILFDENLDAKAKRQKQLQPELKLAIANNELELFYQPIVDAVDYKIIGFEGLARWKHHNDEWISPDEFIPISEKTGLIDKISLWALETACEQIDAFNRSYPNNNFYISVNISPSSFSDELFYKKITHLFNKYHIKTGQLKLEITERMLMKYSKELVLKLNSLIKLGCELMIDDFGTGYSSLSYLHILPISIIKIDRSFIFNLEKNNNTEMVINTIITLSKSLNMSVVSEGIETLSQAIKLQNLGSNALQGYYFSKPIPIGELIKYLEEQHSTVLTEDNLSGNGKVA